MKDKKGSGKGKAGIIDLCQNLYGVIAEIRYCEDCEMIHGRLVLSPKALMFINGQYMEIAIRKVVSDVLAKLEKKHGNRYVSFSKRREKGMPDDTACDVKRILVGNQIILNLLMSNTQMERFGIMETMRATDLEQAGSSCMIRTAANVKIDSTSVLAYEVVRDTPDSYEKLMSKLERYYSLIHSETYLDSNYHGDASYPQMIICGESRDHNIKIAEYLRANGMWSEENTILFTEDLLNMKRSLVSIYALADDNSQMWYALPENNDFAREVA